MSKLGESILTKLSVPIGQEHVVEHYEDRHRRVEPIIRNFQTKFPTFKDHVKGAKTLDIGCYEGLEAVAIAMMGASEVIGIDIRTDPEAFEQIAEKLDDPSIVSCQVMDAEKMDFPDDTFDLVVTLASFEHFADPEAVLAESKRVAKPGGRIYATSGVWSSPYGSHMHFFTKVPWVQYLFSEKTIMKVRARYRQDGAKRYHEVEGGLNGMSVSRFKRMVADAGLEMEWLYLNPVKGIKVMTKIPFVNEMFSNSIYAVLVKP